ncbi:MAG: hypothetical protein ISR46_05910 [Rhodospirillales bacterium]|nr:hypothetical protein [Rhodospirillales bacterium]
MFSAPGSLMVLAFATSAMAGSGKFTTTQLPYWNVGQYNGALSDACQRNIFNQKKIQTLNIGYLGKKGMGVTGIATREWNLNDPTGLAKPNITYHFYNDRYSNCKVYIAHVRPRRQ